MTWNQSDTFTLGHEADAGTLPATATQNSGTVGSVTLTDPPGLEMNAQTFKLEELKGVDLSFYMF